jgi:hypothetical protein
MGGENGVVDNRFVRLGILSVNDQAGHCSSQNNKVVHQPDKLLDTVEFTIADARGNHSVTCLGSDQMLSFIF